MELTIGRIVKTERSDDHLEIVHVYTSRWGELPFVTVRNHRSGEVYTIHATQLRDAKQIEFQTRERLFNVRDMDDMQLDPETWAEIREKQWELYNAPRPLPHIWREAPEPITDDPGPAPIMAYVEGITWQAPFWAGWFFSAVDPTGIMRPDETMDREMARQDAHRIRFITNAEIEVQMKAYVDAQWEISFEDYYQDDPMLMRSLAHAMGLPWRDPSTRD